MCLLFQMYNTRTCTAVMLCSKDDIALTNADAVLMLAVTIYTRVEASFKPNKMPLKLIEWMFS